MDVDTWLKLILALLGLGVTITLTLIRFLFLALTARTDKLEEKVYDRLQSIGHDIRDIRGQVLGVTQLMVEVRRKHDE